MLYVIRHILTHCIVKIKRVFQISRYGVPEASLGPFPERLPEDLRRPFCSVTKKAGADIKFRTGRTQILLIAKGYALSIDFNGTG